MKVIRKRAGKWPPGFGTVGHVIEEVYNRLGWKKEPEIEVTWWTIDDDGLLRKAAEEQTSTDQENGHA